MQTNNKLREALEDIGRIVEQIRLLYSDYPSEMHEIARKVNAALAEPIKNCEVGTAEEQSERFDKFCHANINTERCCGDCPAFRTTRDDCELIWTQLPYESEARSEQK